MSQGVDTGMLVDTRYRRGKLHCLWLCCLGNIQSESRIDEGACDFVGLFVSDTLAAGDRRPFLLANRRDNEPLVRRRPVLDGSLSFASAPPALREVPLSPVQRVVSEVSMAI
jgi:hypothetical protein